MLYILLFFFMPILSIVFLMLFLLPFKFTFDSIITLLRAPKQIINIATNLQLRRNHALEHATINVLEKKYGLYNRLSGWAVNDGFYINGINDPALVEEAAKEGLLRLQRGEKSLVVHKRCGTSMTVANILSSLIFLFLLFQTGNLSILYVVIAIFAANLLAPAIGSWMQKFFTTSHKVTGMKIERVYFSNSADSILGMKFISNQQIFVQTKNLRVY